MKQSASERLVVVVDRLHSDAWVLAAQIRDWGYSALHIPERAGLPDAPLQQIPVLLREMLAGHTNAVVFFNDCWVDSELLEMARLIQTEFPSVRIAVALADIEQLSEDVVKKLPFHARIPKRNDVVPLGPLRKALAFLFAD